MMYIFEGIDSSGKDTIIDLLIKEKPMPVFNGFNVYDQNEFRHIHKFVNNKEEWQKAISFEIINFCKQTKVDVIVNRFIWSEIIYSQVLRGGADWNFYFDVLDRELKDIAKIIYVAVSSEEAKKRIEARGKKKSQLVVDSLGEMSKEFYRLFQMSSIPKVMISSDASFGGKTYLNDEQLKQKMIQSILYDTGYGYGCDEI